MAAITEEEKPSTTALVLDKDCGGAKQDSSATLRKRAFAARPPGLACEPGAFVARETRVIRLVRVRLDRWRTMRSCYLEGREGSQHKNEVHTSHGSPAGPRQNRLRQARRSEGHEPAFDCEPRMQS